MAADSFADQHRRATTRSTRPARAGQASRRDPDAEARLRLAIDAAGVGTFDWDVASNRIVWSKWHETLWGYAPGTFPGTFDAFKARVHPDDLPGLEAAVSASRASRGRYVHEFRVRWPDGSVHWIGGIGQFYYDDTGRAHRMVGVVLDVTPRRVSEQALAQSHERLRALSARLDTLREQEAARISREIHDELGQLLTGIKLELRWMERRIEREQCGPGLNAVIDKLVDAGEMVDQTLKSMQRIAADLRPSLLDHSDLAAALEVEAERLQRRAGIRCRVRSSLDDSALPDAVRTTLFRVCQEALTNVVRHAHASEVLIELIDEPGAWTVRVSDDGVGMAHYAAEPPRGLGLLGMQERARALGGLVSIQAGAARGTVVSSWIPRHPPERL